MANTVILVDPRGEAVKAEIDRLDVRLTLPGVTLLLSASSAKDRVNWADALHRAAKMFEDLVVQDSLKDAVRPSPKVVIDVDAFKAGKTYTVDGVTFAYNEGEVKP